MSSQLLKESIEKDKDRIAIMKRKLFSGQLLFGLLVFFLFPIGSIAQEDSIKVGVTTRQMLVYAPPGIEQNRPGVSIKLKVRTNKL